MEWTDTLMLDAKRNTPLTGNRPLPQDSQVEAVHAFSARLIAVQGVSLLYVNGTKREEISTALGMLRGFRATGRRIVLCDTSKMIAGRPLGREIVENGAASTVISCGACGRDLAIGARDAGLDLSSVVVCRNAASACDVLVRRLSPGDTVLLWGIEQKVCDQLVAGLEQRFSKTSAETTRAAA